MNRNKKGVRLAADSIPPNFNLGHAEGTPCSAKESPIKNYEVVFNTISEPIIVIDIDGMICAVNNQYLVKTEYNRDEIIGTNICNQLENYDREANKADIKRQVDICIIEAINGNEEKYNLEMNFINKHHKLIGYNFSGSPIINEDGNVVGIVCLGKNLLTVKTLKEELAVAQNTIKEFNQSFDEKMGDRLVEMKQRTRMLEELSITDELTKLFNRRYLFKRATEEMQRAKRYETPFSVVTIDIDWFKKINDTYGHLAGDMVLYELSGIMRGSVRQMDVVARTGGEEFIILLPSVREGHAFIFCERLREKVKNFQFTYLPEGKNVTISLGIADFPREGIETLDELIQLSDQALYKAKETRNATVSSLNL